jgi:hypothetical protein
MLRNSRGHFLQHHELYPLLGIEGRAKRLPDAGFEKSIRVGLRAVTYRCDPIGSPGHRLRFLCDCSRWIPFGRAGQHLARCDTYERTERALRNPARLISAEEGA